MRVRSALVHLPSCAFNLAAAVWRIVRLGPNELTAEHVGRLVAQS
jgi:hypothetical protein